MPVAYKEQITATFRDNAIRSVLFIDDDYLSYSDLSEKKKVLLDALTAITPPLADGEVAPSVPTDDGEAKALLTDILGKLEVVRNLTSAGQGSFKRTKVAEEFVKFFHGEKFICDVESQTNDLKADKIRKSDLIILDYCLSGDDATKSLQLLRSLSDSKHSNLVVIYTNKPLDRVWQQIASTLRTPKLLDKEQFFENDLESLEMWEESSRLLVNAWDETPRNDLINYILGQEQQVVDKIRPLFCDNIEEHEDYDDEPHPTDSVIRFLIEKDIRKSHLLTDGNKTMQIHGKDRLWIQCGEVFIALCEKAGEDDAEIALQPKAVWDKLEEALHDWYPSFYRVITSEVQNHIEDANLSMNKFLIKEDVEQIAALWGILRAQPSERKSASRSLLSSLLSDVLEKVESDSKIIDFVEGTAVKTALAELPEYESSHNSGRHKNYIKSMVDVASENLRVPQPITDDFRAKVAHALNEQMCISGESIDHISTGLLLKTNVPDEYYLCITPSCNTVPNQNTGKVAQRMKPHRPMRFLKLIEKNLKKSLSNAHDSDTIFVTNDGKRIALSVYEDGKAPTIEQVVVPKHNNEPLDVTDGKLVQFNDIDQDGNLVVVNKKVYPIAKLRAVYASRYQNLQLQHEARIGVDYISADFR
ncbi:response regulator receiver domain [Vibrio splendidus]